MEFMQKVLAEIELCEKHVVNKTLGQMKNETKESLKAE